MTRKQYERKMMQVKRNIYKYGKENGMKTYQKPDKVVTPHWGTIIEFGIHKGEKLTSYKQSWEITEESLRGTPFLEGVK